MDEEVEREEIKGEEEDLWGTRTERVGVLYPMFEMRSDGSFQRHHCDLSGT